MRSIANKIRSDASQCRLRCLKHKYPKGIEMAVIGTCEDGFSLIARCRKRKRWEVLRHKKSGPSYTPNAMMPFFDFLNEIDHLRKRLAEYGVAVFKNTNVSSI